MAEMLLAKDHDVIEAVRRIDPISLSATPFCQEIKPKSGDPVCPSL
jgi:hypothetical protein